MKQKIISELDRAIKQDNTYQRSWIYDLDGNRLAKGNYREQAKEELELNNLLQKNNINAPKVYGIIEPQELNKKRYSNPRSVVNSYLIMEKINGVHLSQLESSDLDKALNQYKSEIKKVLDLSVCPKDGVFGDNILYLPEKDSSYLIDFEDWEQTDENLELEIHYELINELKPEDVTQ